MSVPAPHESQIALLRELDAVRKTNGLNLAKALRKASSQKSAWSKWLNLETSPTIARLRKIAEVFGARLTWVSSVRGRGVRAAVK